MSRISDAQTKYPKINWDKAKTIDPSSNHKYIDWIGNNITALKISEANYSKIKEAIISFEKKKAKLVEKDITKYTYTSLIKALEEAASSRKEEKIAGTKDVGEINDAKIVMLESAAASKIYSAGTKWCISQAQHFDNYIKNNNIFVISKNGTKLCVLIDASSNQSMVYMPNDTKYSLTTSKLYEDIYKFTGIKNVDDELFPILEKCKIYSKANPNFYFGVRNFIDDAHNGYKIDFKKYINIIKNKWTARQAFDEIADNLGNTSNKNSIVSFIEFIFNNKKTYPEYAKVAEASNKEFYDYKSCYYTKCSQVWKRLTNPPKDHATIALDAFKKRGGLSKVLKNDKNLATKIANLIAAAQVEENNY